MQLYQTGDDALLENMQIIASEVLKYYPDHIESLSILAIVYMLTDQLEDAIKTYIRAEKLAPEDVVVLSNLAEAYKRNGQNEKAIEYYEKVIKYGDDRSRQQVQQIISELKK